MSTAILVPSLNRPQRLAGLIANIHETTEDFRLYFCVSDPESKRILTEAGEWFLDDSDTDDRRYVTRMNKLVRCLQDEEHLFFGSDDVVHHPGWLTSAQAMLVERGTQLTVVNDLRNASGTQAVIKREYLARAVFDSPGDAFHHGYTHNFADNEMWVTAGVQAEYSRAMDSIVEHLHPLFKQANSAPWDDTYRTAMTGWAHDETLFQRRHAAIMEWAKTL